METVKNKLSLKAKIIIIVAAVVLIAAAVFWVLVLNNVFSFGKEPKLTLVGKKTVVLEAFDEYKDEGAKLLFKDEDISNELSSKNNVDTKKVGEYTVEYSYTYKDKQYSVRRKVKVADTKAPNLVLNGNKSMTVSLLKLYKEPGFKAVDNCDGDLNSKVEVVRTENSDGTYTMTYTVADNSGNTVTAKRNIIIKDIVKPKITLKGFLHNYIPLGQPFSDAGVTATDDADGNITSKVITSGTVNVSATGVYTIKYAVTDKSGNSATATRQVTVFKDDITNRSRIYLTFDDGPSSNVTPRILDILKQNGIKATFFICDYSAGKKPIILRMINEGHTIGIHGFSHDYAKIYASDEAFMQNIYKLQNKLKADFGYNATIIRFPGGSSNSVSRRYNKGIMGRLVNRVTAEGYIYHDWNVSSGDATGNNIAASRITQTTLNGLVRNRNNIVLMHDSSAKSTTAAALQGIINSARGMGYSFLPITTDTIPNHHNVNNK